MANSYTVLWTNDLCRGVVPGGRVFAIRAWQAALYTVCAMEVRQIVDYDRAGAELADEDYPKLIHWHPSKSGCISEVVLGAPGTPIRFDAPLPGDCLEQLTSTWRRGERKLKYVEDGRLLRALSLQGIYRLAPDSAHIVTRNLTDQAAEA
ncbi:hypothetical protein [Peterkaempfera bronchialis]|uniref:Uncharacterized protein n=1 Tax=Peterkaempfera bronchialis TaxID=2126346 RepID=A0A345SYI2_9ACTN|nr:hypothetical protein [Peterkaempfera bronchialis]AXI78787.1 hypothetical protein C7M71_016535 [Peterkaempfera bronchialis]